MEIGKILREAREKNNLSLVEVEEATKIRKFYLIALENDDFQSLPGQVYTIGFIKAYARFLGLDPTSMVEFFKSRGDSPIPAARTSMRRKKKTKERENENVSFLEKHGWKFLLGIIAAVMILFVLYQNGYFNLNHSSLNHANVASNPSTPNGTAPLPDASTADQNSSAQSLPTAQTPAQPEKELKMELVAHGDCWTEINTDGQDTYKGILKNGDRKAITAKHKIILTLGNSGVIEVFRGGKNLGYLGGAGEVVRNKEFVLGSE